MGIRTKLLLPHILAFVIFAVLLHFYWAKNNLDTELNRFILHQNDILATLEPGLVRAILVGDLAALHDTLDSNMQIHQNSWRQVVVTNEQNSTLYPVSKPQSLEGEHMIILSYNLGWENNTIARLELSADWSKSFKVVNSGIRNLEFIALTVFGLITLAAMYWQNNKIRKPLHALEIAATKLAKGQYDAKLPKATNDELGHLTNSFAVMRSELQQSYSELESRVQARTIELEKAKQVAEQASLAKTEFLSRMSHELRTPLNAILGFGQLLEIDDSDPMSETHAEWVHEIIYAGNHLLELITEVLDLSSIEEGQLNPEKEEVNIGEICAECVAHMSTLAAQQDVVIHNQILDHDLYVLADRKRVRQILLNLLSNAVKYNCKGGSVTLSTLQMSDNYISISVADTGIGIDKDEIPRLFEPFERLSASNSKIEGTGIGLSITKKLVEVMNGNIGVESKKGTGSTFWFELPKVMIKEPLIYS